MHSPAGVPSRRCAAPACATRATIPGPAATNSPRTRWRPESRRRRAPRDGGVVRERRERSGERALHLPAPLEQAVALEQVEVRQRGGAARGVAGVRRRRGAARRRPGSSQNGAATLLGDHHAAERQVAAGDALRERDHVGHDVPALDPEPGAQAAEAADHRVDDEQDAVLAADAGDRLEVAVGGEVGRRRRRSPARRRTPRRARGRSRRSPAQRLHGVVRDDRDVRRAAGRSRRGCSGCRPGSSRTRACRGRRWCG